MVIVKIPFNKDEMEVCISEKNFLGVLEPNPVNGLVNLKSKIIEALRKPINSRPLVELASGKKRIVIVITDITRPTPDHLLIPAILKELEGVGVNRKDITILVATGLHRPNNRIELSERLGEDVVNQYRIVNHVAINKEEQVYLGQTTQDCPIWINRIVAEADLVISTGIIEPHFYAGFSGGRKNIAIGVAGEETIMFQHRCQVFDHPCTQIGNVEGNIFHENAMEIAQKVGLDFMVNVVLNNKGEVAGIIAGHVKDAFDEGVRIGKAVYQVEIEEQADIAIAGIGFPKDTNLYQATRGASCIAFSPYPAVKKGGLIIIPAETREGAGQGVGEQRFYQLMKKAEGPEEIIYHIKENGFPAGGQRAYLMGLTLRYAKICITNSKTPEVVRQMHMKAKETILEALVYGMQIHGKNAKVIVLPHSLQVITTKNK
ncbi:nickel-dependent lactate racemase [Desulfitibacter alkalitolerans]|uniref:nickel-dependent lactate racemase n=1 Tax=Desulfitibacter alkalitolerans TaxID=264641 RepID=UPI000485BB75|nr:nickel-dependent lactate racemase [Desulfitibacter alkalitolerans]